MRRPAVRAPQNDDVDDGALVSIYPAPESAGLRTNKVCFRREPRARVRLDRRRADRVRPADNNL